MAWNNNNFSGSWFYGSLAFLLAWTTSADFNQACSSLQRGCLVAELASGWVIQDGFHHMSGSWQVCRRVGATGSYVSSSSQLARACWFGDRAPRRGREQALMCTSLHSGLLILFAQQVSWLTLESRWTLTLNMARGCGHWKWTVVIFSTSLHRLSEPYALGCSWQWFHSVAIHTHNSNVQQNKK